MNVDFTIQELQNLLAFLERAQLTGKEAFVYVQLVTKLMAELNKTRPYPSSVEEPSPVM